MTDEAPDQEEDEEEEGWRQDSGGRKVEQTRMFSTSRKMKAIPAPRNRKRKAPWMWLRLSTNALCRTPLETLNE